jgi:enhancing lycopene biosynthesis protein 2
MTKKVAVVLSGCGVYDGAEIHESVLTLLALDRAGAGVQCFAPDMDQHHVINHTNGQEMPEKRNVLVEAARIARGKIMDLKNYLAQDYDALIFPGGFGTAKNLFTFAVDGPDFKVQPDVERAIKDTYTAKKPIGALCISPVLLAKLIEGVNVTIGQDENTASVITNKLGAKHTKTTHGEIVVDEKHRIITTPCYMLDASIRQIAEGADNLVQAVLKRA